LFEVGPEVRHHAIDAGSIPPEDGGRGAVVGGALERADRNVVEFQDLRAEVIRQSAVPLGLGPKLADLWEGDLVFLPCRRLCEYR